MFDQCFAGNVQNIINPSRVSSKHSAVLWAFVSIDPQKETNGST